MKRILDFIKNLFIFAYILVIIFITVCLLAYNDYKLTVFGDKTLVPVIDDDLEPSYTVGDLLIIKKNKIEDVKVGDVIFFYRTRSGETTINFAPVTDLEELTATETTITVEGDFRLSSTNFIGKTESASVIPNVGRILHTLESKWGFLFLGVFPSLLVFLYTLYSVVLEFYDVRAKKNKKKKSSVKTENENGTTSEETAKKVEERATDAVVEESTGSIEEDVKKNENDAVEVEEEKEENTEKTEIDDKPTESEKEETHTEEEKTDSDKLEAESIKNMFSAVISNIEDGAQEETKAEETKEEIKEEVKEEPEKKAISEEDKKSLIEEKMKTLTPEQKKALIEAKLKAMTPEQKKALIEAKKKKLEEQKNGDS